MNEDARRIAEIIGAVFGVLLQLVVGAFYLASGLVAPPWGVALLWTVWVMLSVLMWRWRKQPFRVLLIPFGAAAFWWGFLTFGDLVLGWTA